MMVKLKESLRALILIPHYPSIIVTKYDEQRPFSLKWSVTVVIL